MTILPKFKLRPNKKQVSWRRRHLASTAHSRIMVRKIKKLILMICKGMEICQPDRLEELKHTIARLLIIHHQLSYCPDDLRRPLHWIRRWNRTIDSFRDEQCFLYFRFETKDKLHRAFTGFQFPEWFKDSCRHKYSGEEVFLVGLYRLRTASTLAAACWESTFGLTFTQVSSIFLLFLKFLVENWGYLLTNNVEFWVPYLSSCALAVRNKLQQKGVYFDHPLAHNGFRMFGFIDNTMNATCRPGGCPNPNDRDGGVHFPRNDPLIQRSFYNGWKNGKLWICRMK